MVALALGLTACQDDGATGQTASISGVVTDDVGAPLAGATVSALVSGQSALVASDAPTTATTSTGSSGEYTLECPEGTAQVRVTADGLSPVSEQITMRGRRRRGSGDRGVNFDLAHTSGQGPLARMDADGDGQVAASEWKGPQDLFLKIDTDASGTLSPAELDAARADRRDRHPRHGPMDTDGDGLVSRTEWLGPPEMFAAIDSNGDGQLSSDELRTAMQNRIGHGSHGPPPGGLP